MTISQLAGLMVTLFVAGMGFFKYYLDAKIELLYNAIDRLDKRDERLNTYIIYNGCKIPPWANINTCNALSLSLPVA